MTGRHRRFRHLGWLALTAATAVAPTGREKIRGTILFPALKERTS